MAPSRQRLAAAAVAALASRGVLGQLDSDPSTATFSSSNLGQPMSNNSNQALWGLPISVFDAALSNPKASMVFPFNGPDITTAYPGSSLLDGWSLSINVTADLPLAQSALDRTSDGVTLRDKFTTGARYRLSAPGQLVKGASVAADASWDLCIMMWHFPDTLNGTFTLDDGSCTSVLPQQCVDDFQAAASRNAFINSATGARQCQCVSPSTVPSCGTAAAVFDQAQCMPMGFDSRAIQSQFQGGSVDILRYAGPVHAVQGDLAALGYVASATDWPMMVVWGSSGAGTATSNIGRLNCVRAKPLPKGDGMLALMTLFFPILLLPFLWA